MAERFQLFEAAPLAAGTTINKSDIPHSENIAVNDTVIDKEGYVFQVTAVAATTVTVGDALYRLITAGDGVPHYYFETEAALQTWLHGSETKPDHYVAMTKSSAQSGSSTRSAEPTLEAVLEAVNTATDKEIHLQDTANNNQTVIYDTGVAVSLKNGGTNNQVASLNAIGLGFTSNTDNTENRLTYGLGGISGIDSGNTNFTAPFWRLLYDKESAGTASEPAVYTVKHHYKEYKIELDAVTNEDGVNPLLTINNVSTGTPFSGVAKAESPVTTINKAIRAVSTANLMCISEVSTAKMGSRFYTTALITTGTDKQLNHASINEVGYDSTAQGYSVGEAFLTGDNLQDPTSFELKLSGKKVIYKMKIWGRD